MWAMVRRSRDRWCTRRPPPQPGQRAGMVSATRVQSRHIDAPWDAPRDTPWMGMSRWPEPGGAAHAGRIAVLVRQDRRRDGVAERIAGDAARQFRIEMGHVRQAAAQ